MDIVPTNDARHPLSSIDGGLVDIGLDNDHRATRQNDTEPTPEKGEVQPLP